MARTRGRIGNPSPNKRAVLGYGATRKPRVLRALDPLTFKTLQRQAPGATAEGLDKVAISKNVIYQRGRRLVAGRRQNVRRLFKRDPYNLLSANAPPPFNTGATVARFAPEAAQVDVTNPNPEFHPERAPGAIRVVRQPQAVAGRRNRGRVVAPNRFTLFGGKTLRRR